MFEKSSENNQILKAVATELGDCCEEIKAKIENLSVSISDSFRRLRGLIITNFNALKTDLKKDILELKSLVLENRTVIIETLDGRLSNIQITLDEAYVFLQRSIRETKELIITKIKNLQQTLIYEISNKTQK